MATKMGSGFCANTRCTAPHVHPFSSGNKVDNGFGQFGSTRYGPSTSSSLGFAGSVHWPISALRCAEVIFVVLNHVTNVIAPATAHTTAPATAARLGLFMGNPPLCFSRAASPGFGKLPETRGSGTRETQRRVPHEE